MQVRIGDVIREERKQRGISQEVVADQLGVTVQAVSKWETNGSLPDILLLPKMAAFFGLSLDELFFGKQKGSGTITDDQAEFSDDNVLRVVQYRGKKLLSRQKFDDKVCIPLEIPAEAENVTLQVEIWGSADIEGDVRGNISAGSYIKCENIEGNVSAGNCINCGDVTGDVSAGNEVNCGDIGGDLYANGNVECGDINGNTEAGGNIECGDIGGNAKVGGDIECGEVGGI